jgi:hypothetical protein
MRYAELAFVLVPAGVILAWAYGVRGFSRRGVVALLVLFAALGGALYWFGAARMFDGQYVPAHLVGDQIVPGHEK